MIVDRSRGGREGRIVLGVDGEHGCLVELFERQVAASPDAVLLNPVANA